MAPSGGSSGSGDRPRDRSGDSLRIAGVASRVGAPAAPEQSEQVTQTEGPAASTEVVALDTETAIASEVTIQAIAQDLSAGAIDVDTARSRIVATVVRASVPHTAAAAWVAEIHAEVEALLQHDPTLNRLLS